MNDHPARPWDAAAALVIGGVLVVALPRYALSIIQLVIVTVAVVAGLYALAVNVPPTGWMSPFKWMSPFGPAVHSRARRKRPDEIRSIRSMLSGWRRPVQHGPPMPPAALRILRHLIREALAQDRENDADSALARRVLSPLAWAVLTSDLPQQSQSRRFQMVPPNRREVAEAVHTLLDEIEGIAAGAESPAPPPEPERR